MCIAFGVELCRVDFRAAPAGGLELAARRRFVILRGRNRCEPLSMRVAALRETRTRLFDIVAGLCDALDQTRGRRRGGAVLFA
ncbi:MAG TPA: hypothetical protein VFF43_08735, partial [Caldimonas sp.]|nr:hypothetical protein [Caldimonas sp.]